MEYFITGTDTDIGKTFVTKGLALAFLKSGKKVGVFKPLQSGAIKTTNGILAPDIEAVKSVSKDISTKYSYLLDGEVSPALAARLSGIEIDTNKIKSDFLEFSSKNDVTLVEGAGGILAPATDNLLCADLIKLLGISAILVTTPFLGRLNHTLLTINYAKNNNINIKGIIINKMPINTVDLAVQNFVQELKMYTNCPILGTIKDLNENYSTENLIDEFFNLNLI